MVGYDSGGNDPRRVLAVGAHPDDIELGCGGTLLRHRDVGDMVWMLVMTGGELGAGAQRGRIAEAQQAANVIGADLLLGKFYDGQIPLNSDAVNVVEDAINRHNIDTVYVHSPSDAHQDHLLVSRATIAAARKLNRILFYQSPSTTEFNPTVFLDITKYLDRKLEALKCHKSQLDGSITVDLDVVRSTAHYWGSRGKLPYAEAFEPYRFAWDIRKRVEPPKPWDGVERRKNRAADTPDTPRPTLLPEG